MGIPYDQLPDHLKDKVDKAEQDNSVQKKGQPRTYDHIKQGHYWVNGQQVYFRSKWEWYYALFLEHKKHMGEIEDWAFEVKEFWFEAIKRGTRSYKPDFQITYPDGRVHYHEVKGYMDSKSKTKLKRMAKYHPDVVVKVVDKDFFKKKKTINWLKFIYGTDKEVE